MSKIQLTNIQQTTDWCELNSNQQEKVIGGGQFLYQEAKSLFGSYIDPDTSHGAVFSALMNAATDENATPELKEAYQSVGNDIISRKDVNFQIAAPPLHN